MIVMSIMVMMHDPHPHSPPVPCSRVPNDIHSTTCSSLRLTNPTETWLGMTTVDTVFARTSQAKHDFQLNKAMNMRWSRGTTNRHTRNSTSTSSRHRHHSHLCVEGEGKGKGCCGSLCCGLSFPTPPLWFPVLWFHVLWVIAPPVC